MVGNRAKVEGCIEGWMPVTRSVPQELVLVTAPVPGK